MIRECYPYERVSPFVRLTFKLLAASDIETLADLERKSGVSLATLYKWRQGATHPRLDNLEAVLNCIGYGLTIVQKYERREG